MTRSLVRALPALLLAACTVGDPLAPTPGLDQDVDAGNGGGHDAGGGMDGGGNGNACENLHTPPDGHHNAGMSCIAGGCHDGNTAGAPRYYVAGTLYADELGTAPRPGATIIIPTGGGNPIKLIVANNGNFWSETSMTLDTKPKASGCPNLVQMPENTTDGNCNKSGCHASGSRMALPLN
ncbi:MAG TPA: hypothetical protein VHE35_30940 [Kofleriaceae bacterium]|nr:hypothetical protein [Kofleriaceae bacterium]